MSVRDDVPPVAADEAARLLQALREAAQTWSRPAPGAGTGAGGDPSDSAPRPAGSPHPSTCSVCPVCIAARRLQAAHPDAVAHLLDAAGSLLAALSAVVAEGPARTDDEEPRPPVEHIPVQE